MASVYDIKLFVRDNGRRSTVRTDNYFELRNRGMGFYMELRSAIILACMNVDRGMAAFRLFCQPIHCAPAANGETKSQL